MQDSVSMRSHILLPICFITLLATSLLTGCKSPARIKTEGLAKAAEYEKEGRYADAIIECKNAVKADPNSEETHYQLGRAYLLNTQYKEAYEEFEKVLQLSPGNLDAQLNMGQICLRVGRNDDALQIAKDLQNRQPVPAEARLLLADAYAAKGIPSLAISELHSLVQDEPKLTAAHINLGMLYASAGMPGMAESELQRALELEPGSFNARKALAALYLSTGRPTEAESLYRAALQSNPNSADVMMTLAQFYQIQNRQSESEQIYKQLIVVQKNSPQSRFALANFYLTQNQFDNARQVDENIASTSPDFLPARLQLSEIALNTGDNQKAEAVLAPLLKDQKQNADVQIIHARLLLREHQPQNAIGVLDGILKQGNLALAHYLLGVAYSQVGDLERADSEMQAAIGTDPRLTDAYLGLGRMMLNRDQPKAALQYARLALKQAPDRADCLVLAGSASANLRDFPQAEHFLMAYATSQPNSSDAFTRLGALRVMQKRYPEALDYFEKSWQLDKRNYSAFEGIASVLILKGDKAGALRRVNEALQQNESPGLLSAAGKVFFEIGDYAAAEAALQKSVRESPGNYDGYAQLGALYARQNRVLQAITYFESAVRQRPADIGSWTMLGMLNQQRGDPRKAEEDYLRVLDIEPNAGVAANNLAWLYADNLHDMDKALELARRAKAALPDVPNISDTLGWIYTKQHLSDSAIPLLQEAVKSEPKHAEYHYHLAVALLDSGRKVQARQEMVSAVRLDNTMRGRSEARELLQ